MKQPDIVRREAFLVMGTVTHRKPGTDRPEVFEAIWNDFETLQQSIKRHSVDSKYYGVSFAAGPDGSFDYMAGMAVRPVAETPEGLEVLRHSCAHLMAQAILRLFPGTEITIGPVVEHGFYYDVKRPEGFSTDDLARIEETMHAIVREDLPVRREELPKADAAALFRAQGQHYKVEIIEGIPDPVVSLYRQGEFVDLCRGPHLPSTGRMGAFKMTSVAGAYWRDDARNEQLQRLYGTAWGTHAELDAHLARLEEAKQRDHRRLGQALDLFSLHPIAPGSPFFHPKGARLYNTLVDYIRGLYARYGYTEVITPLIYKTDLYKTIVTGEIRGVSIPFASAELLWKMKQTGREKDTLDLVFLRELLRRS